MKKKKKKDIARFVLSASPTDEWQWANLRHGFIVVFILCMYRRVSWSIRSIHDYLEKLESCALSAKYLPRTLGAIMSRTQKVQWLNLIE